MIIIKIIISSCSAVVCTLRQSDLEGGTKDANQMEEPTDVQHRHTQAGTHRRTHRHTHTTRRFSWLQRKQKEGESERRRNAHCAAVFLCARKQKFTELCLCGVPFCLQPTVLVGRLLSEGWRARADLSGQLARGVAKVGAPWFALSKLRCNILVVVATAATSGKRNKGGPLLSAPKAERAQRESLP